MNKINFLIKEIESIKVSDNVSKDAIYSLSIKSIQDLLAMDFEKIHSLPIYNTPDLKFSLYIELVENGQFNTLLSNEIIKNIDLLTQLIFHPNYKKVENKPVFFFRVISKKDKPVLEFLSALKSYMIASGFDGAECLFINDKEDPQTAIPLLHYTDSSFQQQYSLLLKNSLYINRYITIINESNKPVLEIIREKKSAEEELEKNDPDKYFFWKKHLALTEEVEKLRHQFKNVTEDLTNQKIYMNIMREEDEASKINNFYFTEYEILPLWYKKFGHVLKVLTGKRNFRSLFDSNVKKYKD